MPDTLESILLLPWSSRVLPMVSKWSSRAPKCRHQAPEWQPRKAKRGRRQRAYPLIHVYYIYRYVILKTHAMLCYLRGNIQGWIHMREYLCEETCRETSERRHSARRIWGEASVEKHLVQLWSNLGCLGVTWDHLIILHLALSQKGHI